jgi:hypothetical protein
MDIIFRNIYKQFKWVLGLFTLIPMWGSIRLGPLQLHETQSKSNKVIMAFVFCLPHVQKEALFTNCT